MPQTYTEQLDQIQATIAAIETGAQSYSIAGRSFNRADLDVLYKREARLLKKVGREARGGMKTNYIKPC